MPSEEQFKLVGEAALKVGEKIAPEATGRALNLLSITGSKTEAIVESVLPQSMRADFRAMVHVGPNDGRFEIVPSMDQAIVKARQFEAESRTAYAAPKLADHPQFTGTQKTDTLVVGGGFTGLSIANKLAASGVKTILVDAGKIGETTSKFAGGMITRAGDASFADLAEEYGDRTVGQYTKGMVRAHKDVMGRAAGYGDKVDFKPSESHQISYDQSAVPEWIRAEHQAAAPFDNNIRVVTGPKAAAIFEPAQAVMTFKNEGQVNPLKYSKQMAALADHQIFERSPIVGLQAPIHGGPVTAFTANGGKIVADRVVFATGTGGNLFRDLDHCVEGAQCFAGIAETPNAVKIAGNFFDTDGARRVNGVIHNRDEEGLAYNYFRKPADALDIPGAEGKHLLLFGGADKMLPETAATRTTDELHQQLQTLFPGSKMLHEWSGLIEESKDGMPIIAQHPELPQVYGIRGVGGSGLDSSQFVANELADKVLKGGDSVLSAKRFGQ